MNAFNLKETKNLNASMLNVDDINFIIIIIHFSLFLQ